MSTAYLLYRPAMDYEESIQPGLIFTNREQAEKAKARLFKWAQSVFTEMGEYPYGVFDDAKEAVMKRREEIVANSGKAPYGWDFSSDISAYTQSFLLGCIEVMELPKNPKP